MTKAKTEGVTIYFFTFTFQFHSAAVSLKPLGLTLPPLTRSPFPFRDGKAMVAPSEQIIAVVRSDKVCKTLFACTIRPKEVSLIPPQRFNKPKMHYPCITYFQTFGLNISPVYSYYNSPIPQFNLRKILQRRPLDCTFQITC